jgi:cytochrome P450
LNANSIWVTYWIIALHLQLRPEGISVLRAEVDVSRKKFVAMNPSATSLLDDLPTLHAWLSTSASSMPLLSSAIQETLRFCSSTRSTRVVTRDVLLAGKELKKDDRIICLTRPLHMDEEIHECAGDYEPARYMDAGAARYKDGRTVANHTMPFGGGASLCPGRSVELLKIHIQRAFAEG